MREIVLANAYYEYAMYVTEEGFLCHNYFLPRDWADKPDGHCPRKERYPGEAVVAVDFEGRLDCNVGNRQLAYRTSYGLLFEDYSVLGEQNTIRLYHPKSQLEVQLIFSVYEDSPVLYRYTRVVNRGKTERVLNHVNSFFLGNFPYFGDAGDLVLHTYHSAWSMEGEEQAMTFPELDLCENSRSAYTVENNSSFSTNRYFPCFVMEEKGASLYWGAQLHSSSQWRMEVGTGDLTNPKWFYMQGGMVDFANSGWYKKLAPGEAYETPGASLTVASGKIDQLYNQFHTYQHDILMRRKDDPLLTVFNDWQAMAGDSSEEGIIAQLSDLQKIGVEVYVTDAGWYTDPGQDWAEYVGCWTGSRVRFPGGLSAVSKAIAEKGMIPGIWCEIEMAGPHSPIYDEEDMFLKIHGRCIEHYGRRFLDFSKEKVRTYASGVFDYLYRSGFRYIKIDYNADCAPGCDGPDSIAENLNRKRRAYGTWLWDIREKYPNLMIEHCASGGMKLDYENLARASLASITDQENHIHTGTILCNVSKLVHPAQCGNWSRIAGDFDRKTAEFVLTNSMMGRMCLSAVLTECSTEVLGAMKAAVDFYKKYRFVIEDPWIHYHTLPGLITDEQNLKVMEYNTKDGRYGLIYISAHDYPGSYTFTPYIRQAGIVDCYPDMEGITRNGDRISICHTKNELYGRILVLCKREM